MVEHARFLPFSSEQLRNPLSEILSRHLVWLTREVITRAIAANVVQEAGRLGAGFDSFFYFGQNLLLNSVPVWIGYWPLAWERHAVYGPLWAYFYGRDASALVKTGSFPDGRNIWGGDLAIPLFPASGGPFSSQEDEAAAVVGALNSLSDRLGAAYPAQQRA